MARETSYFV